MIGSLWLSDDDDDSNSGGNDNAHKDFNTTTSPAITLFDYNPSESEFCNDGFFTNEDEIDEDSDGDLDDYVMNIETSQVTAKVPSLSQWKEVPSFGSIQVTVGKGKRAMWAQAKEEIYLVKKNVAEMVLAPDVASEAASPLLKTYHTLFGTSSLLCNCFCRYLGMTKSEYLHFLFSFTLSCKNQQSVPTMESSREFKDNVIMDPSKYVKYWTSIKEKKGDSRNQAFWRIVEDAVNQQLKTLFMSADTDFPYLLGYDDDKLHFDYSGTSDMQGLSPQHHVKDNRKGLTLHTCAYSATGIPVCISFQ